ncbi:TetR/AcrR family transcriptional regulator [Subtercola boreus]|uniref:TetR family transcriptional regulator n=1 Tax=Subtercola boreus TaxID=120213 RepID=A0A3E0WC62_9MICO|nr:TetR family transcriptional regulator [Subtercola boreus]RFA21173.1 TetR family transcriptional regulator [Subtercola boreus]RFA21556.1 TetR family transcriptional regulator [Subtercola boreus]RFA27526.1 TetR family transcriptional regulator [Subtercola boreus]
MTTTPVATQSRGTRSTAEDQRLRIVARAVEIFSRSGYQATPVASVAAAAKVSTAYVFRLFDGKLGLFVSAVDDCYAQVAAALTAGAGRSVSETPTDRLDAMSLAYIELIRDRSLIALQVHAQSACDVPEIRDAVRRGISSVVHVVTQQSGADDDAIQRFLAYGQLCHLVVQAGLADVDTVWARTVDHGIRHD